ncbi:MAG: LysM peptidoglycan-binding domain-containing M23 family metallopeptidase [Patescibacteria group bacterium]
MSLAFTAKAGFFSLFSGVFASSDEYLAATNSENSQTVEILEASGSLISRARGGGEISLVEGEALLAENVSFLPERQGELGSEQITTYTVREGDTLSQISEMFGVSINTIRWANDLKRVDSIRVGQSLVILPVSGVKHIVKKNDTLANIAKQYKGDLAEIIEFNDLLTGEALVVGETVIIPDGEIVQPPKNDSGASYAGYYERPIKGGKKTQGLHGYNGVDLATYAGAPVYAAAEGQVVVSKSSGWNGGYGNYVVIKHPNKTQTLYAHLSKNLVKVGTKVAQGQVIGENGSTGKSTGPHLHFEVRGAKNPF